jgi:hypothetical protein
VVPGRSLWFTAGTPWQGDSCIGSKTSINFGRFKNQVGALTLEDLIGFYQRAYEGESDG